MSKLFSSLSGLASSGLLAVLLAAGCGREEIKVYRVSKEVPQSPAPVTPPSDDTSAPPGRPGPAATQPKITWTLPAGWQETSPGQMSRAAFNIAGTNGDSAQVSITPLRGLAGKEVAIVNLWRQQVGQPELSPAEAEQQFKPVQIGSEAGRMFDITGQTDAGAAMRVVTAMFHRGENSWFFKLAGHDALVEAQKPAFIAFLNSIKLTEGPVADTGGMPQMGGPATSAPAAEGDFKWAVPAGWKSQPIGQMQLAKYSVPEVNGAKADATVSVFASSTGGVLANVNRWRRQIELPPLTEAEAGEVIKPLDAKLADAVMVDMTSGQRQLIGAIVPRNGQWFFYKLLGDATAVAPQKEAFLAFAKSQP